MPIHARPMPVESRSRHARRISATVCLLVALAALPASLSAARSAAPVGTGLTVAYGISRSGSAGAPAGACGSRLQCMKAGITAANAATAGLVENVALLIVNVADPDQDVDLSLPERQLLIAPDADPNENGRPDFADAVDRVSLGGGTCFACALLAAKRSLAGARPGSRKVIVLVSERENTFRSSGFTSGGAATGYPSASVRQLRGSFDANTVVRAFAVGRRMSCTYDPWKLGSLAGAAAVTPGGSCTHVSSFAAVGAAVTRAVAAEGRIAAAAARPAS